jgi:hypothetical protein
VFADPVRHEEGVHHHQGRQREGGDAPAHDPERGLPVATQQLEAARDGTRRPRADGLEAQHALDVVGELVGAGVAARALGIHRLGDDRLEVARQTAIPGAQRRGPSALDHAQHAGRRGGAPRLPALRAPAAVEGEVQRQRLVERDTERVEVGTRVEALGVAADLLGRGVGDRPDELPAVRSVASASCTRPKSESSAVPSARRRTFEGLTSRCTSPARCSSPGPGRSRRRCGRRRPDRRPRRRRPKGRGARARRPARGPRPAHEPGPIRPLSPRASSGSRRARSATLPRPIPSRRRTPPRRPRRRAP